MKLDQIEGNWEPHLKKWKIYNVIVFVTVVGNNFHISSVKKKQFKIVKLQTKPNERYHRVSPLRLRWIQATQRPAIVSKWHFNKIKIASKLRKVSIFKFIFQYKLQNSVWLQPKLRVRWQPEKRIWENVFWQGCQNCKFRVQRNIFGKKKFVQRIETFRFFFA